jgi:hypothetical protein
MNFAYLGSLFLATTTTTAVRMKAIMKGVASAIKESLRGEGKRVWLQRFGEELVQLQVPDPVRGRWGDD